MALQTSTFRKLQQITGKQHCSREKEDLICYSYDAAAKTYLPDVVVFPGNIEEISAVLKLANRDGFAVVPRGAGSGMTGGSVPVDGGAILVMTRFSAIKWIDKGNLVACAEAGVVTSDFHKAVEAQGLFYPPDPSSSEFSTLGGNLAECAGGPRAVKYGVTRDYVLGLEGVLPTGEIIKTGVQTVKSVVGYDLTRLFTGSEGTLCIVASLILRLLPLPETIRTMTAVFDRMETAAETVSDIIQRGIIPRTIEYMDNAAIKCSESKLGPVLPPDAGALLLMEVDGNKNEADAAAGLLEDICMTGGALKVETAESDEQAAALWQARRAISPSLFQYGPDKINEDIVVPRNKIPDMVRKIRELRDKTGLTIVSFGHAGDGNIHFNIMLDKTDPVEFEKAEKTVEALFEYTVALGGSISGEHGIGITKSPFLEKEVGPVELDLMKKIKKVFDPNGILNPGKIFYKTT